MCILNICVILSRDFKIFIYRFPKSVTWEYLLIRDFQRWIATSVWNRGSNRNRILLLTLPFNLQLFLTTYLNLVERIKLYLEYLKFRRLRVVYFSPLLKRECEQQVFCSNCWSLRFFSPHFFSSDVRDFHYIVEAELSVEVGIVQFDSPDDDDGAGESQLNLVCDRSCFSATSLWSQKVQHSLWTSTVTYTIASKSLTVKLSICFVIWRMTLICYFNCFLVRH